MQKHWGIFLGMLKKVGIFLGKQILKLGFLGVKNMNLCRTPPVIKLCEWGPWGHASSMCRGLLIQSSGIKLDYSESPIFP